jgi:hypothetical protein
MNPHVAQKLFTELTNAEMAHLETGISHAAFLAMRRHKYNGEARRELDRVIALGMDARRFIAIFLAEFEGEY